jgi:hypothetical protein
MSTPADASFDRAARRAVARVVQRRWLSALSATVGVLLALLVLVMGLSFWFGGTEWLMLALVLPAVWLLATLAWAWWRRPGPHAALALWDEAAGRREAYANAWWFAVCAGELSPAARAHVESCRNGLATSLQELRRQLPLPWRRSLLLPFLLAAIAPFVPELSRPEVVEEPVLGEAERGAAQREAERLARIDWEKKTLEGLNEAEKRELEALQRRLEATAEQLQAPAGRSARDVLAELERRAREAEKLAGQLGAESWASEALIEALRRQTDTADLGDAVAAQAAEAAAKAAEELAGKVGKAQPEVGQRLQAALEEVARNAEAEDRERPVGEHVLGAGEALRRQSPAEAEKEFKELAGKLRDLSRRERSQQELEKLAEQLREAGSRIAGEGGAAQPLAATSGQGQADGKGQAGAMSPSETMPPGRVGEGGLQPPGQGQSSPPPALRPPGQGQAMQLAQPGIPGGSGKPDSDAPMLLAPVPGQNSGDKSSDQMLMADMPGASSGGASLSFTVPGGRDPGAGTAQPKADPTTPQAAAGSAMVNAAAGGEGPSSVRSVAGGIRQEQAARGAVSTPAEFLAAEEAALDEVALPPARREQVRRYFTELRRRFEAAPK